MIEKLTHDAKPFLRWAGSKKKLLYQLEAFFQPHHRRYIEPFAGSAQLFFRSRTDEAILNDINKDLIDTYKQIKQKPITLYKELVKLPVGRENYYKIRSLDPLNLTAVEKAARFIYLNTFCFNGLYRTNNSGKFNVPYSPSSGKIIDLESLKKVSRRLKSVGLYNKDFEKLIWNVCQENDFVYLDPPYAIRNKDLKNQYGHDCFGIEDLTRLKNTLIEIDRRGASFVLSYAECEESNFLRENWNFKTVNTIRNISGFSIHRKKEKEVFISNINL